MRELCAHLRSAGSPSLLQAALLFSTSQTRSVCAHSGKIHKQGTIHPQGTAPAASLRRCCQSALPGQPWQRPIVLPCGTPIRSQGPRSLLELQMTQMCQARSQVTVSLREGSPQLCHHHGPGPEFQRWLGSSLQPALPDGVLR